MCALSCGVGFNGFGRCLSKEELKVFNLGWLFMWSRGQVPSPIYRVGVWT